MRLICHKCTNYFLLRNFFLLFYIIYLLSISYLSLIYPLSTPYLPLIYPPRWRKLAACVQFKIQNSKLFSTEPSAKESRRAGAAEYVTKESRRAGAAEYVKPVRLALYTNFTCRWNGRNDQRLYFFC